MKNGFLVNSVYTDFRKTYDTVTHWMLIFKLKSMEVGAPFIDWLSDRVKGCILKVKIGDYVLSDEIILKSGVLQGSSLPPLLFLVS